MNKPDLPYRASPGDSYAGAPSTRPARRRFVGAIALAAVATAVVVARRGPERPTISAVPAALRNASRVLVLGADPLPPATPLAPLLVSDQPERLAVMEPAAGATRVPRGQALVVRFNRPMVAAAMIGRALPRSPLRFTPEVRGVATWTSRSTLSFAAEESTWEVTRECSLRVEPGMRALSDEALADDAERVVVFDGSPRLVDPTDTRRVAAGAPLRLAFTARVDASALRSQLLAYEVGGAMRPMTFSTRAAGRDADGRSLVDVILGRSLEPGARVALAFAPVLRPYYSDGEAPGVVSFEFMPRPQIEGVDCPEDADDASSCSLGARPGRVVDVRETLRLLATTELDASSASAVSVTPAVPGLRVEVQGRTLSLRGEWAPDQVYEVRFAAMRSAEGIDLLPAAPLAVRSAGLSPSVTAATGRLVWERAAEGVLPFAAVNAARGFAQVAPLDDAALVAALLSRTTTARIAWQGASIPSLAPSSRANRWGRGALDWRALGHADAALVRLDPDGEGEALASLAVAQRTDLGVSATRLSDGVLVWVTSLSRARSVGGARVRVFDDLGAVAATATADADGVAWVPLPRGASDPSFVVVANQGDDRAAMLLDPRAAAGPGAFNVAQGEAQRDALAPVAAVILDRGAYRPGEKLRAKVVARVAVNGALRAFARQSVRVVVNGPTGEIAGATVRLSRAGTADAEFTLASAAVPGSYAVAVVRGANEAIGQQSFEVAEFRQPNARVDLALDHRDLTDGDRLGVNVRARYLFGAPLANGTVRWSLRRTGADELPARWTEFAFGPIDAAPRAGTVDEGAGVVGADGTITLETHVRQGVPVRERDVFEVTVRDASGQETSARETFTSFPAAYEVGLRRLDAWIEHGRALDLDAIVIGHDGNPVPGVAVEAKIFREGWHGYYEWAHGEGEGDEDGRWQARRDRQREQVHQCAVNSAAEAVRCAWQPTAPGTYVIEATVTDAAGRRSVSAQRVYVAGPTEHPDRDPPGAPITVTPVRTEWFAGERSRLSFECPWPEAEAMITVVREGVLHREHRRVQAGTVVVELPVTAAMIPNAFVAVTIVRPRTSSVRATGELDLGAPDVRWGVTELTVRPQEDPLQVEVVAATERAPGSDVPIDVSVRDARGAGVATEVLLYAVDEGVLRLTRYETPDPSRSLLPRRAPQFSIEDLRRSVVSRIALPALPNASGDGGEDSDGVTEGLRDQRERFDPTPLWLPRLSTDAQGRAHAVIHLPDRAGQYRVMAVAIGEGLRSGRASTMLNARRDVVVRALLPRAVTEGDRFEVGALLNNTADHAVDATVVCTMNGRDLSRRAVRLEAGAEQRVGEMVDAQGERMDVSFVVEAGADRARDGRVVPVAPRSFAGRMSLLGAFDGRAELVLARPAAVADPRATLTVSTQPFLGLDAAAEDLDAETWGATESVASRVLGWAALARGGGQRPAQWSARQAQTRGELALAGLLAQQTEDGGFGTWGPQSYTDPYLTAYALRALAAAKRLGWRVEEDALSRATSQLTQWVRGRSIGGSGADDLAFTLRVLHDVGADQGGVVTQLFEQREVLGPYGCAQLAMAMMPGDPRRETLLVAAGRLVGALSSPSVARPAHFDSQPRTLAAVLEAAARTDRFTLARDVAGQLLAVRAQAPGAGWGNAHATAHAIDALALYASRFAENRSLRARVWVDGVEVRPTRLGDGTARFTLDPARLAVGDHRVRVEGAGPLFTALDGRWRTPYGEPETVARGRALALHRVLETESGRRLGEGDTVRVGELVRVRLWVYAEQRTAPYVVLRNAHGGGFEAVDEGLDTTPQGSIEAMLGMSADDAALDPRVFHALRSVSDITARRLFGGVTVFHLDQGVQGLREYTYGVRATTPGRFLIPPSEARALYDDATVARGAMDTLVVTR